MSYLDYTHKMNERMKAFVAEGLPLLAAVGVTKVTCTYDGSGDSGALERPIFYNAEDKEVEDLLASLHGEPLKKMTETYFYDYLENKHSSWEINDGSFGEFVLDIVNNKIELTHNERRIDYDTSAIEEDLITGAITSPEEE